MPEDEVPDFAKDAVAFHNFQREQYEKMMREKEQNYHADLSGFVSFISDLTNEQLSYVHQLIEDIGGTAYSQQLIGIIVGERVHKRGLMVDGRTYEEALALGGDEESAAEPESKPESTSTFHEYVASREQDLMDKWGLVREGNGPLKCEACGKAYASIEDADESFIKHDGCTGCHHKEKWG